MWAESGTMMLEDVCEGFVGRTGRFQRLGWRLQEQWARKEGAGSQVGRQHFHVDVAVNVAIAVIVNQVAVVVLERAGDGAKAW